MVTPAIALCAAAEELQSNYSNKNTLFFKMFPRLPEGSEVSGGCKVRVI